LSRRATCTLSVADECTKDTGEYVVQCVLVNSSPICGGIDVLSAGQTCSTTPDDLSQNFGCIAPSVCLNSKCNSTADNAVQAVVTAPCLPNSYLNDVSVCVPRLTFGTTCLPVDDQCAQNAFCVTTNGASTCVEWYSRKEGEDCGGINEVCEDDLVCASNDKCAPLVNHKLSGCTEDTISSVCGDVDDYLCVCDYGKGSSFCYGEFNRIGAAMQAWGRCMVTNDCDVHETHYFGSCGDINCSSDWSALYKAEQAADNGLLGSSSASTLIVGAAVVLLAVFFAL